MTKREREKKAHVYTPRSNNHTGILYSIAIQTKLHASEWLNLIIRILRREKQVIEACM